MPDSVRVEFSKYPQGGGSVEVRDPDGLGIAIVASRTARPNVLRRAAAQKLRRMAARLEAEIACATGQSPRRRTQKIV